MEVWRTCLLAILNLALYAGCLPAIRLMVAQVLIPKPGRDPTLMDSYRAISLLGFMLKLLDKLLHNRISQCILPRIREWQRGGVSGADHAAWMLSELLRVLQARGRKSTFLLACVDGEVAFC